MDGSASFLLQDPQLSQCDNITHHQFFHSPSKHYQHQINWSKGIISNIGGDDHTSTFFHFLPTKINNSTTIQIIDLSTHLLNQHHQYDISHSTIVGWGHNHTNTSLHFQPNFHKQHQKWSLYNYNTSNDIQNFHDPSSFHSPFKHCQRSSYDQLYHLTVGVGMTNDDIRQFSKRQTLETDHHKSNLDLDLSTHLLNTSHAPPTTSNNSSPSPRFLSTSKDSRSN